MMPYNVLTSTRYGTMLANHFDVYVGNSLLLYGEFSQLEVEFLGPWLKTGNVVLDLGANVGALTVPFAKSVGRSGCVMAFEPQRICFQTLCANVALNSLTNVIAFPYAVGCEGDSIRIPMVDPYKRDNFGGKALSPDAPGEAATLVSLDEFNLPRADLVKIDVEGMEPEALKGGRRWITEHKPVLYVEADRKDRREELLGLLDELGYDAWTHNPPLYNPNNYRGDEINVFGPIHSLNLLCLPRGQQPPEGLERAA